MKQIFTQIATTADFSFEAMEVDRDHLHCLVKSEPKNSPLSIVRKLTQQSTFRLWQRYETDRHRGNSKKNEPFGVMSTFIVRWAMPVRRLSAATLPVKGEMRRFIHEAEDLVDEAPDLYKNLSFLLLRQAGRQKPGSMATLAVARIIHRSHDHGCGRILLAMSISRSSQLICKACRQPIFGDYLNALGAMWHPEHFVCAGCGRPITDASFQERQGAPYHDQCYLNQVAPRCAYCGKPLTGQYVVSDGKAYHNECYRDRVVPRCAYCGKPLMGEYLVDHWGTKYCKEHQSQYPSCLFCGRLVPPQQQELHSGDNQVVRCPICRASAVDTIEQAQPLFRKLIQWVNSQGLMYNNLHLSLELCDRAKLAVLLQSRAEPHSLGVTSSSTYTQNGQVVHTQVDGIAVLRGMPSTLFQGVTIHELGHAWLAAHNIRLLPLWAEEGFCELLSYRYYMEMATDESRYHAKNIEQNPNPVYGNGFRRIRSLADAMGFRRFVETLRTTKQLPSG